MDQDRQNSQFLVKEWSGNHNKRTASLLGYFSLERIPFCSFLLGFSLSQRGMIANLGRILWDVFRGVDRMSKFDIIYDDTFIY